MGIKHNQINAKSRTIHSYYTPTIITHKNPSKAHKQQLF